MSSQPQEAIPVTPKVGVGLVVTKTDAVGRLQILMGRRRGAHSAGDWALPGGHFDFGEEIEATVRREAQEECGSDLAFGPMKLLCISNIRAFLPDRHYLDLVFRAEWVSGEPQNMEPDKCEGWHWVYMDEPPTPLSPFSGPMFEAFRTGQLVHEC
jgi:8-oxo-dGTP diphosphatase